MASPNTVGTASQGQFNADTVALADASGYSAGDGLLAVVSQDGNGTLTVDGANSSSGWVKLGQHTPVNPSVTQAYFYKKNAAGPGSDDLTVDSTVIERGTYILQPVTGQDTATDAYLGAGAEGPSAANACNPPSLDPGQGSQDYLAVAIGGLGASSTPITGAPTNYSGLLNESPQTSSCSTALAFRQLTATSEDPGTFTHAASAWIANTVLIPPAAGGGGTPHTVEVDDTVSISDNITPARGIFLSVNDSAGVADALGSQADFLRDIEDTAALQDSLTWVAEYFRTIGDTVGIADSIAAGLAFSKTVDDLVSLADDILSALGYHRTVADSVTLTDDVQRAADYSRTIGDSVGLTDDVTTQLTDGGPNDYTLDINDAVIVADVILVSFVDAELEAHMQRMWRISRRRDARRRFGR